MGLIYKRISVKGNRGTRVLSALLDTGASHTVIRAAIARKLATPAPLARPISAQFARGKGRITEMVSLALRIDGNEVVTPALVFAGLTEDLVIGTDFLQRYKVVLDPEREEVRFSDPNALKVKII